jgi:hypothetical protein
LEINGSLGKEDSADQTGRGLKKDRKRENREG